MIPKRRGRPPGRKSGSQAKKQAVIPVAKNKRSAAVSASSAITQSHGQNTLPEKRVAVKNQPTTNHIRRIRVTGKYAGEDGLKQSTAGLSNNNANSKDSNKNVTRRVASLSSGSSSSTKNKSSGGATTRASSTNTKNSQTNKIAEKNLTSGIYFKKGPGRPRTQFKFPLPLKGLEEKKTTGFKLPWNIYRPLPNSLVWRSLRRNCWLDTNGPANGNNHLHFGKDRNAPCICSDHCGEDCLNRILQYECDKDCCPFGDKDCGNRSFQKLQKAVASGRLYYQGYDVVPTGSKGYGLRATRSYQPHELIIEYTGEVISNFEMKRRMKIEYKSQRHFYCLSLGPGYVIDSGMRGSAARFVNHSCEPNCEMEKWYVKGQPRIGLFAGEKGIEIGDELTYDYNFEWLDGADAQLCKCGSAKCRGVIGQRGSSPAMNEVTAKRQLRSARNTSTSKKPTSSPSSAQKKKLTKPAKLPAQRIKVVRKKPVVKVVFSGAIKKKATPPAPAPSIAAATARTALAEDVVRRGPGRPRKVAPVIVPESESSEGETQKPEEAKRRRGRPPKTVVTRNPVNRRVLGAAQPRRTKKEPVDSVPSRVLSVAKQRQLAMAREARLNNLRKLKEQQDREKRLNMAAAAIQEKASSPPPAAAPESDQESAASEFQPLSRTKTVVLRTGKRGRPKRVVLPVSSEDESDENGLDGELPAVEELSAAEASEQQPLPEVPVEASRRRTRLTSRQESIEEIGVRTRSKENKAGEATTITAVTSEIEQTRISTTTTTMTTRQTRSTKAAAGQILPAIEPTRMTRSRKPSAKLKEAMASVPVPVDQLSEGTRKDEETGRGAATVITPVESPVTNENEVTAIINDLPRKRRGRPPGVVGKKKRRAMVRKESQQEVTELSKQNVTEAAKPEKQVRARKIIPVSQASSSSSSSSSSSDIEDNYESAQESLSPLVQRTSPEENITSDEETPNSVVTRRESMHSRWFLNRKVVETIVISDDSSDAEAKVGSPKVRNLDDETEVESDGDDATSEEPRSEPSRQSTVAQNSPVPPEPQNRPAVYNAPVAPVYQEPPRRYNQPIYQEQRPQQYQQPIYQGPPPQQYRQPQPVYVQPPVQYQPAYQPAVHQHQQFRQPEGSYQGYQMPYQPPQALVNQMPPSYHGYQPPYQQPYQPVGQYTSAAGAALPYQRLNEYSMYPPRIVDRDYGRGMIPSGSSSSTGGPMSPESLSSNSSVSPHLATSKTGYSAKPDMLTLPRLWVNRSSTEFRELGPPKKPATLPTFGRLFNHMEHSS